MPFIHKAAIGPAEVAFKQCQPSDKQLTRSQHETGSGDQLASAAAPRAEPGDGGLQLQVIHVRCAIERMHKLFFLCDASR